MKRARRSERIAAISSALKREGVPPPKKTVSNERPADQGAVASISISVLNARTYRRISLSCSSGAVLNEQ